jgi:Clostripain family.
MNIRIIALSVLTVLLLGCGKDEPIEPKPKSKSNRTVLIYMSANNNLSDSASGNLQQIVDGTSSYSLENNNLIVYLDRNRSQPMLLKIYDGKQDTIKIYDNQNSGSPEVLGDVINKVRSDYNANSFGLILWGHGTSWLSNNHMTRSARSALPAEPYRPTTKGYGSDNRKVDLSMDDLQIAIPDNAFDYIIFDACYMASVEVAYTLRNKTEYIVSSAAEIWDMGFPYMNIIDALFANDIEISLKTICDRFYNYYFLDEVRNRDQSATISLVSTAGLSSLAGITGDILRGNRTMAEDLSLSKIQWFDRVSSSMYLYPSTHILYDMEDYISNLASEEQLSIFNEALKRVVIYERHTDTMFEKGLDRGPSFDVNTHCGLTIYPYYSMNIPELAAYYQSLDWYNAVYR